MPRTEAEPAAHTRGLIVAHSEDAGRFFAAFDQSTRFTNPSVATSRFSAHLSPFPSRDDALTALAAVGAVVEHEGSR